MACHGIGNLHLRGPTPNISQGLCIVMVDEAKEVPMGRRLYACQVNYTELNTGAVSPYFNKGRMDGKSVQLLPVYNHAICSMPSWCNSNQPSWDCSHESSSSRLKLLQTTVLQAQPYTQSYLLAHAALLTCRSSPAAMVEAACQ